jgi:hypothetical protein
MAIIKIYQILPNGVFGEEIEIDVENAEKSQILPGYTRSSPHPIPVGHYAYMNAGWKYAQGSAPAYPSPEQIAEQNKANNKLQAEKLLQETDWSQMPDVALLNKQEFTDYRAAVRVIAVNPPTTPVEFPNKPQELWS